MTKPRAALQTARGGIVARQGQRAAPATPAAAAQALRMLAERDRSKATLRVFIAGRHGTDFRYGLALAGEPDVDDLTVSAGGARFIVDLVSAPFLSGATIDYVDDLMQKG